MIKLLLVFGCCCCCYLSCFNASLINLNVNSSSSFVTIYKCPIKPLKTETQSPLIDSSVLVFRNKNLANVLDKGEQTLIVSDQFNILHKIDSHHTFTNEYTFAYGHMASLEFILKETQTYQIANQTAKFVNTNISEEEEDEERVKDETMEQLKVAASSSSSFDVERTHYYSPPSIDNNNNKPIFKCNGKRQTNGMNTHYLILKYDEHQDLIKKLRVGDVFYGDKSSFSYMETIRQVETFNVQHENA